MKRIRLSDRLRYAFDNSLSRGPAALVLWLGLGTVLLVVLATAIVWFTGQGPYTRPPFLGIFLDVLYQALTPNPVDPGLGPWPFMLIMLIVTVGSLLMVSILIGIMTASIDNRVEKLRRGRSRVLETNHTVILGWSEQVFTIISELVVAKADQRRGCIVIMGEHDKVEMEEAIREKVGRTGHIRIVCRSGSPISLTDLQIVSLDTACAIIILGPESDYPDSSVIKTILAITKNPHRRPDAYHLVAEIRHPHNVEAAQLVGGAETEILLVGEPIARIIAQTAHQSGLSEVYSELLDFSGDEIHFAQQPELAGRTFSDALLAYEDSALMGICAANCPPRLNPPMDTVLQASDRLMFIARDAESIHVSGRTDLDLQKKAESARARTPAAPERTLILGWSWRGPSIISNLDSYVPPGSIATVLADFNEHLPMPAGPSASLANLTVTFQAGDTTSRRLLDSLGLASYTHVIVLAYDDTMTMQEADAHTLVSLLHLRDLADHMGHPYSIVSEMLDVRNRALAEVTRADDFVVSGRLVSLMLAQISETKDLNAVFNDLLSPEGSELYLMPAADYVVIGVPLNFYTVVDAARHRGEVAIGYRLAALAGESGQLYGVVLNPNKARAITFAEADRIIVVAYS